MAKNNLSPDKTIRFNTQYIEKASFANMLGVSKAMISKMLKEGKLSEVKKGRYKGLVDVFDEKTQEYIKKRAVLLDKRINVMGDDLSGKKKNGPPFQIPGGANIKIAPDRPKAPKPENYSSDTFPDKDDFEDYVENLSVDKLLKEEKIQNVRKVKAQADKADLELQEKKNVLFDRKIVESYLIAAMKALYSKVISSPVSNIEEILVVVQNDPDNCRARVLDILRNDLILCIEDSINEVEDFFKNNPVKRKIRKETIKDTDEQDEDEQDEND